MADMERSVHVGRPHLPGSANYIRLREPVFNLWRERKECLGKSTDSEFAEYLLHRRYAYNFLLWRWMVDSSSEVISKSSSSSFAFNVEPLEFVRLFATSSRLSMKTRSSNAEDPATALQRANHRQADHFKTITNGRKAEWVKLGL